MDDHVSLHLAKCRANWSLRADYEINTTHSGVPLQRLCVHDRRRSDISDYFLDLDLLDMEIFEVLSITGECN